MTLQRIPCTLGNGAQSVALSSLWASCLNLPRSASPNSEKRAGAFCEVPA